MPGFYKYPTKFVIQINPRLSVAKRTLVRSSYDAIMLMTSQTSIDICNSCFHLRLSI